MRSMTKTDQLDFTLPVEFLRLGEMLTAAGTFRRSPTRDAGRRQTNADEVESVVDALLGKYCNVAAARRLLGLHRGTARDATRVRLKAVSLLGWQHLRASVGAIDIGDISAACADPRLLPNEGLLRSRHEIGTMITEDTLIGSVDTDGVFDKVRLSPRGLEILAGGKASMGMLTANKLAGILVPKGLDEYERPAENAAIPSAKELGSLIRERVIGLDEQVSALSSRLVMHLVRARMLRGGKDPGTGNQAILLAGNSSCGKTFLMSEAARLTQCPFASVSATSMTSEGYVGGKLDDLFKALVLKANGDVQASRYGIGLIDEWDKKATRFSSGREGLTTTSLQTEVLVPMAGAEFLITGKRSMERPVMFNSHGTLFCFAGAFAGLAEIMKRKGGGACMGFSSETRTKRRDYVLDSIRDYGFVREWVNRLTAVMFLPDPLVSSLEQAAAGNVLDSFNALLAELGIVLFPQGRAIHRMAAYSFESRTFYRGLKSVWWSIAEQAVASGERGTVLVGTTEVDASIARVASGSVGLPEAHGLVPTPIMELEECNASDDRGSASAGG